VWHKIKNYQETNYLRWNAFTGVGILLIIICGIRVTLHLNHYMDILFWDESLYMTRGTQMFHFIPRDWGPTYSLWYKFLSLFVSDKVELYYFNFKLTTILLSISLFLLMLSCGVQRVLAFILSIFSLSTFINLPVWPHISHFCIIVLIGGIIVAKHQKTLVSKFAIMSYVLIVCAYARPELFLPFFIVLLLTYLFFLVNIKQTNKKEIILIISLTVITIIVFKFLKTPFNNGDSKRSIGVFLQHFGLNYSQWYPSKSPFWLDFFDVINKEFPDASLTLKGLYAKNPTLIKRHFLSNISFYFIQIGKIVISFFAPIFTKKMHWLCLMVSTMLLIVYFSFTKTSKNKRHRFFIILKNNLFTVFVLCLFTFPSVLVCVYAYPRDHYLILQVPILMLFIALAISSITVEIEKPIQKIVVVSTVWFFVMPSAEDFSYFRLYKEENTTPNIETVKYIKKNMLTTKDTVCIFDVEGGLINFLPPNYTNHFHKWKKDEMKLSSFILSDKDIDMIYYTPTMTNLNCTQNDTTLLNLLANPNKFGFYKQKTGNFKQFLLIKETK
jgi:hypothetical protein